MGEKALVMKSEEIINQLCDVIGSDAVITDVKEREYFSMDVFDIDQVADIVIPVSYTHLTLPTTPYV